MIGARRSDPKSEPADEPNRKLRNDVYFHSSVPFFRDPNLTQSDFYDTKSILFDFFGIFDGWPLYVSVEPPIRSYQFAHAWSIAIQRIRNE